MPKQRVAKELVAARHFVGKAATFFSGPQLPIYSTEARKLQQPKIMLGHYLVMQRYISTSFSFQRDAL